MVSVLTNAPSGMTFRQLWKGEAVRAKKELDRIFGRDKLKLVVIEESDVDEKPEKEEKCFAVALVRAQGWKFSC